MKKDNDIEKILLNDSGYEKAVKLHLEQEFNKVLNQKNNTNTITEIKSAPKDKIFSKFATFEVINKVSKTRSYINGVQAEGYLGAQTSERKKLLSGESNSFVSGECFIRFIKVKV